MNRIVSRRGALSTLAAGALAALAAGCASSPEVRHDQDPTADLQAYRTFGFYEPADAGPYASLVGRHLKQAAREQLEHRRYVYTDHDPDLRVAMFLVVEEHPELRSTPGRGRYGYRGWNGGIETVTVREGSLHIDLVDTRRHALVWRGVAEGRVDAKAMREPALTLHAAVAEIFARYPIGRP